VLDLEGSSRLAFLIAELLSQRYEGSWYVYEDPRSVHSAKIVVGQFKRTADNELMIDPFLLAL
jgi:hypothetical protein